MFSFFCHISSITAKLMDLRYLKTHSSLAIDGGGGGQIVQILGPFMIMRG